MAMARPSRSHIIVKQTSTGCFLSFPYNQEIVSVVRNLPERRYDSKKKEWHIPVSAILPAQLKQSLNSIANVEFEKVEMTSKTVAFPVEFIDHLTRQRYSKSTIRNYSHHLGRYLSFIQNLDLKIGTSGFTPISEYATLDQSKNRRSTAYIY